MRTTALVVLAALLLFAMPLVIPAGSAQDGGAVAWQVHSDGVDPPRVALPFNLTRVLTVQVEAGQQPFNGTLTAHVNDSTDAIGLARVVLAAHASSTVPLPVTWPLHAAGTLVVTLSDDDAWRDTRSLGVVPVAPLDIESLDPREGGPALPLQRPFEPRVRVTNHATSHISSSTLLLDSGRTTVSTIAVPALAPGQSLELSLPAVDLEEIMSITASPGNTARTSFPGSYFLRLDAVGPHQPLRAFNLTVESGRVTHLSDPWPTPRVVLGSSVELAGSELTDDGRARMTVVFTNLRDHAVNGQLTLRVHPEPMIALPGATLHTATKPVAVDAFGQRSVDFSFELGVRAPHRVHVSVTGTHAGGYLSEVLFSGAAPPVEAWQVQRTSDRVDLDGRQRLVLTWTPARDIEGASVGLAMLVGGAEDSKVPRLGDGLRPEDVLVVEPARHHLGDLSAGVDQRIEFDGRFPAAGTFEIVPFLVVDGSHLPFPPQAEGGYLPVHVAAGSAPAGLLWAPGALAFASVLALQLVPRWKRRSMLG